MKQIINPPMKEYTADVLVMGGGFPGVCAAIQAARLGASVILVERSNVLGGNCGPDVGVHPSDGHRFHPYMASVGIPGELIEQAAYTASKTHSHDHHYNINIGWDRVLNKALKDAGVKVLRSHYAHSPEVETDGDHRRITAVLCEDTASYKSVRINVTGSVIDDTGDGNVSALAGAGWRMGREARAEYDERDAPEVADSITMGTSLVAIVRNTGKPVEFIPPEDIPPFEPGYGGMLNFRPQPHETLRFFYPTETGGEIDTIEDDAVIYDRLLGHLYSAWNRIKNVAFVEESRNWELLWVSPRPAKRESRRFWGDYTFTQNDAEAGRIFPDAIAYGGFALDVHHPRPESPEYVKIVYHSVPQVYTIPYRSIYSRDVDNLLFASRLLSASHMGHGTVRLQRTLATVGQAAGAAAALCKRHDCTCRELYLSHMDELQQTLLRHDAAIPGVVRRGIGDASISADSEKSYGIPDAPDRWLSMENGLGMELWDFGKKFDSISVRMKNGSERSARITLEIFRYHPDIPYQLRPFPPYFTYFKGRNETEWGSDWNEKQFMRLKSAEAILPANADQFVDFDLSLTLDEKDPRNDADRLLIFLHSDSEDTHAAAVDRFYPYVRRVDNIDSDAGTYTAVPGSLIYRLTPAPRFGEAVNVTSGISRRFSTNPVNMWMPEQLPASLRMTWDNPREVSAVSVTFDTLTRTAHEMPYECNKRASAQCVADFRLILRRDGAVVHEQSVTGNYHRFVRIPLSGSVRADALELVVCRTWEPGAQAGVYEISVD
ncbi:MAG: FAD-dependent oxidoreductase [Ruminococcaceae bacterium]|nr:FAD-dependent oxidoreductase [Oscillospiraceae bacterium]